MMRNASMQLVGVLVLLAGCGSQIVTPSASRGPTSPDQVAIYQKEPKKYEELGVVTVPVGGQIRMDERGDATPAFEELKKRAAQLGANGLLLDASRVQAEAAVTCAYKGTFYQVPVDFNPKQAKVHAIWSHGD